MSSVELLALASKRNTRCSGHRETGFLGIYVSANLPGAVSHLTCIFRTALGQRAKYETIVKAQVAEKLHDLRVM